METLEIFDLFLIDTMRLLHYHKQCFGNDAASSEGHLDRIESFHVV